jgi:CRISPR-associated protein Cas5h
MDHKKALVFDIQGKFAHFRTFYSNASSLSYGFPPRTTVIGIIAAILGLERDSYYDLLSYEKCNIAVSLKQPIRKLIQTVNYIRTKKEDGFNTFKSAVNSHLKRTLNTYPISIELLMPVNDEIKYRISFSTPELDVYNELKKMLKSNKSKFPIYLGLSEFLADIEWIGEFKIETAIKGEGVVSVIPESCFEAIDFSKQSNEIALVIEKVPFHFSVRNNFREISKIKKFIYEKNGKKVLFKKIDKVLSINGENIVWMET